MRVREVWRIRANMSDVINRNAGARKRPRSADAQLSQDALPVGLLPPGFEAEYVAGAVEPFLLSGQYTGETPSLPMIDLTFTK
jgi:hypothetical protein